MGYKNVRDVLPEELIKQIQEYIDGENIYIPRKEEPRKYRKESSNLKRENLVRNNEIFAKYKAGQRVSELAKEYYISPQGIYKIIAKQKGK